jgi:hypothetical protein
LQSAWARARLGDRKIGIAELRRAIAASVEKNEKIPVPWFQGRLAELEAEDGDFEGALARIDEALALADEMGARLADAFLHRTRPRSRPIGRSAFALLQYADVRCQRAATRSGHAPRSI